MYLHVKEMVEERNESDTKKQGEEKREEDWRRQEEEKNKENYFSFGVQDKILGIQW